MLLAGLKNVLILAPHPDDAEFGLGGTITKLLENNTAVHAAVFSLCEKSTPEGFKVGAIEREMYKSFKFLGIKKEHQYIHNYPVREFPSHRQEILENMIDLRKKVNPDLVFIPSSSDVHQDHKTIYEEGIRAFKYSNLLGYEMPWNNFGFTSFFFVRLEKRHLEKKLAALNLYDSQKRRNYNTVEFTTSLAKLRGGQVQQELAESFELIRFIQL